MRSAGWVLLPAISATSPGERPARRAAASSRARTSATFEAIDIKHKTAKDTKLHEESAEFLRVISSPSRFKICHPRGQLHHRDRRSGFVGITRGRGRDEDHERR